MQFGTFFFTENVIYYRIEKIIGVLDEHSACYREKRLCRVVCYWTEYDDSTEKKTEGNLVCSIYWSATMRRISSRL